jgi:hypothetical protein
VAITAFGSRLVRYGRDGRVSTLLPSFAGPVVNTVFLYAMTLDPDGSTIWLATNFGSCSNGVVKTFSITTGAMSSPFQSQATGEVIAVAGEWRAAEQTPPPRRHAAR